MTATDDAIEPIAPADADLGSDARVRDRSDASAVLRMSEAGRCGLPPLRRRASA